MPAGKSTAALAAIDLKQICKAWSQKKSCSFLVQRHTPLEEKEQAKRPLGCVLALKTRASGETWQRDRDTSL